MMWCDLGGDAHPELVIAEFSKLDVLPNRGVAVDGSWLDVAGAIHLVQPSVINPALTCGDIDHDGQDDLLYAAASGLRVLFHDSVDATSQLWDVGVAPGAVVHDISLGDVDHDGDPDLFVALGTGTDMIGPVAPVVYLVPNTTTAPGDPSVGDPVLLYSAAYDARALAFIEVALPPR